MVHRPTKSLGKNEKKNYVLAHLCSHMVYKKPTVVTDASEKTIAEVLLQEGRPIIFVSRKLTPVEQNYPNL